MKEAPNQYALLGARDPRASLPLPPLQGDGVVGSISARWQEWRNAGAPRMVVQWLRSGIPLVWARPPKATPEVKRTHQSQEVIKEVTDLVKSGAFVPMETPFISPTFLIPKRDGGKRLIHDLRSINTALIPPKFTLHGAQDAASVVRDSKWLVALDMRRGYQQVAMNINAGKYLGAQWGNKTVVSTVLPFGLSLSPYAFTRLTSWLARQLRKRFNINVAVYVDDFLLGGNTKEELQIGLEKTKEFFNRLGVQLSDKTSQEPTQQVDYLGFSWDAVKKTISVTKERCREYRRGVKNILRHPQSLQVWRKVIGKLLFLKEAVGETMRHTRSLLWCMRKSKKEKLITADGEAREDLLWWESLLRTPPKLSLVQSPVSAIITTDASDNGLGAVVEIFKNQSSSQEASIKSTMTTTTKNPALHINTKEMEALLEVLKLHKQDLKNKRVVWFSDNQTAKAAIARQGTQGLSAAAWEMAKEVTDLATQNKIQIVPRLVPGRLNGGADSLSRPDEERSEWQEALAKITLAWGPLTEDPFGMTGDSTSVFETLQWVNKRALIAPPIRNIGHVVSLIKLVTNNQTQEGPPSSWESLAVVLTPNWKGALWWPLLKGLSRDSLQLGRLRHPSLLRWEERNGHPSEWIAFLISTRMPYGPLEQERIMKQYSEDIISGSGNTQMEKKEKKLTMLNI